MRLTDCIFRMEAAVDQSVQTPPDVGVAMETNENEAAVGAASHTGQDDLVLGAEGWSLFVIYESMPRK